MVWTIASVHLRENSGHFLSYSRPLCCVTHLEVRCLVVANKLKTADTLTLHNTVTTGDTDVQVEDVVSIRLPDAHSGEDVVDLGHP